MSDRIVLDKDTFKSLASDTRINILKEIYKKQKTQSELSEILNLSIPSIKDHLDSLEKAELIQKDDSRKWKYYSLTSKGEYILRPEKRQFMLVLVSTLFIFGINALFNFKKYFYSPATAFSKMAADSMVAENIVEEAPQLAIRGAPMVVDEVATKPPVDIFQITLLIVLLVFMGLLAYRSIELRRSKQRLQE